MITVSLVFSAWDSRDCSNMSLCLTSARTRRLSKKQFFRPLKETWLHTSGFCILMRSSPITVWPSFWGSVHGSMEIVLTWSRKKTSPQLHHHQNTIWVQSMTLWLVLPVSVPWRSHNFRGTITSQASFLSSHPGTFSVRILCCIYCLLLLCSRLVEIVNQLASW